MSSSSIKILLDSSSNFEVIIHSLMFVLLNPFIIYRCTSKIKTITDLEQNKSYNILSVYIIRWLMIVIILNEIISAALIIYSFGIL
jgi:hypothetical protein